MRLRPRAARSSVSAGSQFREGQPRSRCAHFKTQNAPAVSSVVKRCIESNREPVASLTTDEIRDALVWAASGSPAPYPLRGSDGRAVGIVYTPYVRLAISARVARHEGRPMRAERVTRADIDPIFDPSPQGRWYIGLRLDVTSYKRGQHDFDVVLVGNEESPIGQLDARLATRGEFPLWIGRGRGMAYQPLRIGMGGDDAVYVLAGVDSARLRAQLPARIVAVDRSRGADPLIVEGVITERDVRCLEVKRRSRWRAAMRDVYADRAGGERWSGRQDSNLRLLAPKASALPG